MTDIYDYLKNNGYPGRGILTGTLEGKPLLAYFIMGRSENSRNRVFRKKDGVLYTEAYDPSKVADPSLIIYNACREYNGKLIVTNGNQTDTIYEYLKEGKTFEEALETREYEPDAPNYTPRISALIHEDGSYDMAILKRKDGTCLREYYHYEKEEGSARFLSTYDHDGDPLPSFSKEPLDVKITDSFPVFAKKLWESLNTDNKISLYVRHGEEDLIFNKHEETV